MNNALLGTLVLISSTAAVYTDVPDKLKQVYNESILAAQQTCTAGDLHSISIMLDAKYIMDRRLPSKEQFPDWLNITFKENNIKALSCDHWGNPYIYAVSVRMKKYEIISTGPDGIPATDDDMKISGP